MCGCEGWIVKKAEHRRIDAFKLWSWRQLLKVPWTARKSNQSILKDTSLGIHWKDWCWGWNSNTLATSCEVLPHWKRAWRWEGLGAGGKGDDRGWGGWMASPTRYTWVWVNSRSWWWTERPGVLRFMGLQSRTRLSDWTELNWRNAEEKKIVLFSSLRIPDPQLPLWEPQTPFSSVGTLNFLSICLGIDSLTFRPYFTYLDLSYCMVLLPAS